MLKKHRRNIKRLAQKFCISIEDAIEKFYSDQNIDKNIIFSIKKKRNKGIKNKRKHKCKSKKSSEMD